MTGELSIGVLRDRDDGEAAVLRADRFNRHTFWCGQSGSGKTYALGVVLEQLLIHTRLPMVILDPNSDFVRLGDLRDGQQDRPGAAELQRQDVRVLRSTGTDGDRLHVRWLDLDMVSKAAVLHLDPLLDLEEYNALLHIMAEVGNDPGRLHEVLDRSTDPARQRLARRIENLGIEGWQVWAWGEAGAESVVARRPRATVLDLGGFPTAPEPKVAALAILDHLWAHRDERRPILIVIDEAHNLCSPTPSTLVERVLTERIVQIAAEGRKYGLWLLLSTQRPSKVHPNVLSQCDNLGLMKMSAPLDLAELGQYFGWAPQELLARAPHFAQGEVLMAGGFIAEPSIVQMGDRLTHEGGTDVRVPLA